LNSVKPKTRELVIYILMIFQNEIVKVRQVLTQLNGLVAGTVAEDAFLGLEIQAKEKEKI